MARCPIPSGAIVLAGDPVRLLAEWPGLGRLPGDIVVDSDGARVRLPVAISILVSAAFRLLFRLVLR